MVVKEGDCDRVTASGGGGREKQSASKQAARGSKLPFLSPLLSPHNSAHSHLRSHLALLLLPVPCYLSASAPHSQLHSHSRTRLDPTAAAVAAAPPPLSACQHDGRDSRSSRQSGFSRRISGRHAVTWRSRPSRTVGEGDGHAGGASAACHPERQQSDGAGQGTGSETAPLQRSKHGERR